MMRSRVDLPQPEGPMIETSSPSAISWLNGSNAMTSPDLPLNFFAICSIVIN